MGLSTQSITAVELWGCKTQIHNRLFSLARMLMHQVIILGEIKQSTGREKYVGLIVK